MVITQHGVRSPFLKGVTEVYGLRLTFFGDSVLSILQKESAWLDQNAALLNSMRDGEVAPSAVQESLEAAA